MQKLKNNEAQPKFTRSYEKKACNPILIIYLVDISTHIDQVGIIALSWLSCLYS